MHIQYMAPYEKYMGSYDNWKPIISQDNSEQKKDMLPGKKKRMELKHIVLNFPETPCHYFILDLDQHSALFNPPLPI